MIDRGELGPVNMIVLVLVIFQNKEMAIYLKIIGINMIINIWIFDKKIDCIGII